MPSQGTKRKMNLDEVEKGVNCDQMESAKKSNFSKATASKSSKEVMNSSSSKSTVAKPSKVKSAKESTKESKNNKDKKSKSIEDEDEGSEDDFQESAFADRTVRVNPSNDPIDDTFISQDPINEERESGNSGNRESRDRGNNRGDGSNKSVSSNGNKKVFGIDVGGKANTKTMKRKKSTTAGSQQLKTAGTNLNCGNMSVNMSSFLGGPPLKKEKKSQLYNVLKERTSWQPTQELNFESDTETQQARREQRISELKKVVEEGMENNFADGEVVDVEDEENFPKKNDKISPTSSSSPIEVKNSEGGTNDFSSSTSTQHVDWRSKLDCLNTMSRYEDLDVANRPPQLMNTPAVQYYNDDELEAILGCPVTVIRNKSVYKADIDPEAMKIEQRIIEQADLESKQADLESKCAPGYESKSNIMRANDNSTSGTTTSSFTNLSTNLVKNGETSLFETSFSNYNTGLCDTLYNATLNGSLKKKFAAKKWWVHNREGTTPRLSYTWNRSDWNKTMTTLAENIEYMVNGIHKLRRKGLIKAVRHRIETFVQLDKENFTAGIYNSENGINSENKSFNTFSERFRKKTKDHFDENNLEEMKDFEYLEVNSKNYWFDYNPKYLSPDIWKASYALGNWYRNGRDSVGFHSDHLTRLGPNPIIVSVTCGTTRIFRFKRINRKERLDILLNHGDILIMWEGCQEEWQHEIPTMLNPTPQDFLAKDRKLHSDRVNWTFRMDRKEYIQKTPYCHCMLYMIHPAMISEHKKYSIINDGGIKNDGSKMIGGDLSIIGGDGVLSEKEMGKLEEQLKESQEEQIEKHCHKKEGKDEEKDIEKNQNQKYLKPHNRCPCILKPNSGKDWGMWCWIAQNSDLVVPSDLGANTKENYTPKKNLLKLILIPGCKFGVYCYRCDPTNNMKPCDFYKEADWSKPQWQIEAQKRFEERGGLLSQQVVGPNQLKEVKKTQKEGKTQKVLLSEKNESDNLNDTLVKQESIESMPDLNLTLGEMPPESQVSLSYDSPLLEDPLAIKNEELNYQVSQRRLSMGSRRSTMSIGSPQQQAEEDDLLADHLEDPLNENNMKMELVSSQPDGFYEIGSQVGSQINSQVE